MTEEQVTLVVREAVRAELRGANLIDGPTHIAHHQALAEFLSLMKYAKKTLIGSFVLGVVGLTLLGLAAWKGN